MPTFTISQELRQQAIMAESSRLADNESYKLSNEGNQVMPMMTGADRWGGSMYSTMSVAVIHCFSPSRSTTIHCQRAQEAPMHDCDIEVPIKELDFRNVQPFRTSNLESFNSLVEGGYSGCSQQYKTDFLEKSKRSPGSPHAFEQTSQLPSYG